MKTSLSTLDLNSPFIVESKIRNDVDLKEKLAIFYRSASPRFANFQENTKKGAQTGSGIELSLYDSYDEYSRIIENYISSLLAAINISPTSFAKAVEHHYNEDNESVMILLKFIYCLKEHHFIDFCLMMESKFLELYSHKASSVQQSQASSTAVVIETKPSAHQLTKHVRVLWDIENIPISKKQGGLTVVSKLQQFFASQGLHGPGIDYRITAFFNPEKSKIRAKVIRELDRANVELVWVSKKREDADRKLTTRIYQDLEILTDPSHTTFIIISSDQDFRHVLTMLTQRGYQTIVIHNASPSSSNEKSLEMPAILSVRWLDIINATASTPKIQIYPAIIENVDAPADMNLTNEDNGDASQRSSKSALGWITARCIRWRGCYGFLVAEKSTILNLVELKPALRQDVMSYLHSLQQPSTTRADDNSNTRYDDTFRIYCHHSSLKRSDGILGDVKRSIHRGETVQALIELADRGIRAVDIIRCETS
jgi:acetolactate synthase regulatory subunit